VLKFGFGTGRRKRGHPRLTAEELGKRANDRAWRELDLQNACWVLDAMAAADPERRSRKLSNPTRADRAAWRLQNQVSGESILDPRAIYAEMLRVRPGRLCNQIFDRYADLVTPLVRRYVPGKKPRALLQHFGLTRSSQTGQRNRRIKPPV
jgi:hypothetical protein